jgi:hypothetical protein
MLERLVRRSGGFVVLLCLVTSDLPAWADERTDRLVELLRNSGNYRVRVQSAQSLGRIRDPSTVQPLVEALDDEHPAVRAACALALGRIGSREALSPLRRLASSAGQPPEVVSQVRSAIEQIERMSSTTAATPSPSAASSGSIRFYVGVGTMGNTTGKRSGEIEKTLERLVRDELARGDGIKLAPPEETPAQTKKILSSKGWTGYYVQGSVTRLEEVGGQLHAVISVMVLSNPERDLRMMLQGRGSAALQGRQRPSAQELRELEDTALEGAVRGAISRLSEQLR